MSHDVIQKFMQHYQREYDYFSGAARFARTRLEHALREKGIRAVVSDRAKSPESLEAKLKDRLEKKGQDYRDVDAIYTDIADLAGVRIALYSPADMEAVGRVITNEFQVAELRTIVPIGPESQYVARHFRCTMRSQYLRGSDHRYSTCRIEIQVASLLMHVWAEVNHDLDYKPGSTKVSDLEDRLLKQLNSLVQEGEVILTDLAEATHARRTGGAYAEEVHELTHVLREQLRVAQGFGDVNFLYRFSREIGMASSDELKRRIGVVTREMGAGKAVRQIIDSFVLEDPRRYFQLIDVHMAERSEPSKWTDRERMYFIPRVEAAKATARCWVGAHAFAQSLVASGKISDAAAWILGNAQDEELNIVGLQERSVFESSRYFRNALIDDFWGADPTYAGPQAGRLIALFEQTKGGHTDQAVQSAAASALEAIAALT
ncbi:RelA/SpoT domain-containing protein [Cupriavidus pauculus]|uniref:RelA/SpoT domain-containing protein n=1 Tax=Cupriavidus pauculus TaxID=82633 RepID=UPI001C931A87|nr:RelA/SpoT domain-containing protein [Cupriavidus pauculus]MBY4733950.1 RelA/SpoT domain-containing protein [Cupriavidus pauculus]